MLGITTAIAISMVINNPAADASRWVHPLFLPSSVTTNRPLLAQADGSLLMPDEALVQEARKNR